LGYGISPINSNYSYVDLRFSNSSGIIKTPVVFFNSTSISGVSQGDKIAVSAWVQLTTGTAQGTVSIGVTERNSSDTFLATQLGDQITPTAEFDRLGAVVATLD
jgi:hypothetical protein